MKNQWSNRRKMLSVAVIGGLLFSSVSLFADEPPSMKGNLDAAARIVGGIDPYGDVGKAQAQAEEGFNKLTEMTAPNRASLAVADDNAAKRKIARIVSELSQGKEEFTGAKTGEFVSGRDSIKTLDTGHSHQGGNSFERGFNWMEHVPLEMFDSGNSADIFFGGLLGFGLLIPAFAAGIVNCIIGA